MWKMGWSRGMSLIAFSCASGNSGVGFVAFRPASGGVAVKMLVDRSSSVYNTTGVTASGPGVIVRVGDSTVSGNSTGLFTSNSGQIVSFGTNKVINNTTDAIWVFDRQMNLALANQSFFDNIQKWWGEKLTLGQKLDHLAPLRDPGFLAQTLAQALGLPETAGQNPVAGLQTALEDRCFLLVLDNFEHLMEGVGLLTAIVQSVPGIQLLVTSRERLNLQGEWVFEVEGLPYPATVDERDLENVAGYSAVQLFLQSALRVDPRFAFMFGGVQVRDRMAPVLSRLFRLPTEGKPICILDLAAIPSEAASVRKRTSRSCPCSSTACGTTSMRGQWPGALRSSAMSPGRRPRITVSGSAPGIAKPTSSGSSYLPKRMPPAVIVARSRFIGGEPMKVATNVLRGWSKSLRGVSHCWIAPSRITATRSPSVMASTWSWVT